MSQTAEAETPEQALARAVGAGQARRVHEARGICADVLAAHPEHPGALALLGSLAGRAGQVEEAIGLLTRAVARHPGVATWHANLCSLHRAANRLDDALTHGMEAVRLQPEVATHHVDLGLVHLSRGDDRDALGDFGRALARDPENANAHMAMGELLLSLGEFRPGWVEYEWRNKLDQAKGTLPRIPSAPWNGMRLPGARLLLVADQGFGDMMQFARFIPEVVSRVGEVVVGWGPEVVALLRDFPGITAAYNHFGDIPPHHAHCLMSSLPGLFGVDLDSIPAPVPYLRADPAKVEQWRARLAQVARPGRLRVGIAWSGRGTHPNNTRRSLSLAQLAPVTAVEGVDFVTLQKPIPDSDRPTLAQMPNVLDVSAGLGDFSDTAALICAVDLVLAVDTSVVHLAGALGRPCWVLVPRPADWRWLHGRTDSPWYPTVRLFRQETPHAWEGPIGQAAAALAEVVRER